MKKTTKKFVKRLERYVGKEIIRIRQTHFSGDYSFTDKDPIILLGFTPKGEMIVKYTGSRATVRETAILPLEFTDDCWISYKKAITASNNRLNKWRGKKVIRICATKRLEDRSYMRSNYAPTFITASRHHVLIKNDKGRNILLNCDFANPNEWELAE